MADHERDETKMISVSEEYFSFLHDALSENQARIREILGESEAAAVFSWCADRLVRTVEVGRYESSPVEGVVRKLANWGMAVTWKENGNLIRLEVKCPYAGRVHPGMSSKEPRCPLGEFVLGAVRLEDSKAQLIHNDLTEEGVRFTVKSSRAGDQTR